MLLLLCKQSQERRILRKAMRHVSNFLPNKYKKILSSKEQLKELGNAEIVDIFIKELGNAETCPVCKHPQSFFELQEQLE